MTPVPASTITSTETRVADTTMTAPVNGPAQDDASRKARRTVMLALVHVALAVGILALFVFVQSHKG